MSTTTMESTRVGSSTSRCILAAALLALAGCSRKAPDGKVHLPQATDALASAGLKTDGLKPVDPSPFSAQKCVEGPLEGVDSVLCEYGSVEAAALGKAAGETWAAHAITGAALANGMVVLAVADRSRADPNGKAIQKITHAFMALK